MKKEIDDGSVDTVIDKIKAELNDLDKDKLHVDGINLLASQCYHFGLDPVHVLFNTNCPESLKQKVNAILSKYIPGHESGS